MLIYQSASFETGRIVHRVQNNKYPQLVFTFDKGCTEIKIKVLELIAGIFKSVEKMTNTKLVIICVTTLLCFSGHDLIKLYQTDRNLEQNHELLELLHDKKILYGLQSAELVGEDVKLSFANHAPIQYTESLSFNGNSVSKEEITSIQNKEANSEVKHVAIPPNNCRLMKTNQSAKSSVSICNFDKRPVSIRKQDG